MENFKTLEIVQKKANSSVFDLKLNRPSQRNALSQDFFSEFPKALSSLDQNPNVNVVILSGAGNHFCSGIDLKLLDSITAQSLSGDRGRSGERLRRHIKGLQDAVTAIERCRKPLIASIDGACIGGGVDIVTACDIRFCTKDAFFSVKEVDLAITADLGTLQRLPSIVGYGNAMELALTGRRFSGSEAKQLGLVSRVFDSRREMDEAVRIVAEGNLVFFHPSPCICHNLLLLEKKKVGFLCSKLKILVGIASKSPLAVIGTKAVLLRSRDLNLEQGLDYVATWNSSMLLSDDLSEAVSAQIQKRKPIFAKL